MNFRLKEAWNRHPAKISIIVSILMHLLFVFTFGEWSKVLAWMPEPTPPELKEEPLVFDLTENPNAREDDAPDERTNLLSDRNGRARANVQTDLPEGNVPYNESPINDALRQAAPQAGQANIPPTPPPMNESQQETDQKEGEEEREQKKTQEAENALPDQDVVPSRKKFSREVLTAERNPSPDMALSGSLSYDNRKFDAKELGDFSLNTYNWDFAPYLLELKRRIQRNIFPPPAFTIMGIIEGEYIVRFTILPDGKLERVEVLDSNGHESLERTSVKAVELSAPFLPLPEHFPEDKLVITGRFMYHILDQYGRPMHRQ